MQTYLRNAWYAAAFVDEIGDKPFARTLLGEPMVIYRKANRDFAMLHDRCPHRFAPLSAGQVIGADLQCPYHGLRFNGEGACVHNPHSKSGGPLKAAKVASFPTLEKYGIVWFWAGEPELADEGELPRIEFLERPERFCVIKDRLSVKANYQLIVDNLLDLSHAAFIHPQFAGGERPPEQLLAATKQRLEVGERSLTNYRIREGLPAPAGARAMFGYDAETLVTSRTTMIWHPPALLEFPAGLWAASETEEDGAHIPQLHVITPETDLSSHYFFINGRNRRKEEPEIDAALLQMFDLAFRQQDEPMIEAVQERMGAVTNIDELEPVLLRIDSAPVSARRILAKLIALEQAEAQPPASEGLGA